MSIRPHLIGTAAALLLGGCAEQESGPVTVAAIGGPPAFANPNRVPLDPPSAFLLEAAAQGLVRFDADGEIEPALAQSWIVSDDGLRYTFRIRRTEWHGGGRVTADEVVERLRAAGSPASRNPLKPILGLIDEIEAMTDEVLEITLKAPRPNFLQLLAQTELAIVKNGSGTGPYRATPQGDRSMFLSLPAAENEEDEAADLTQPPILLSGERAALAVARFELGGSDLVLGGTAGNLPIARAAEPADAELQFDPVRGLFGLVFERAEGPFAEVAARRALAMAVDRGGIVAALAVPGLSPRTTLLPRGLDELPNPAAPDWAGTALAARRQQAAGTLAELAEGRPLRVRVAMPEGPGYRMIFASLRRDWLVIGVEAEAVAADAAADLRFVDTVAPAMMAAWYLRNFTCDRARICSAEADAALAVARATMNRAERLDQLAAADRLLTDAALFVPIAAPVRWSLVSPRLTGFRPNPFGRHNPVELIARRQ